MPISKYDGFPDLNDDEDDLPTRPVPLQELPRQVQIDTNMEIIRQHHARIANAISVFWGHKDCMEYMQQMILNGGDGVGRARVGFKQEVLAAFIALTSLHEISHS